MAVQAQILKEEEIEVLGIKSTESLKQANSRIQVPVYQVEIQVEILQTLSEENEKLLLELEEAKNLQRIDQEGEGTIVIIVVNRVVLEDVDESHVAPLEGNVDMIEFSTLQI